ncbi:hypothetical protein BJ980_001666 [Nocardioides daedukensis]|uniref:Bacterial toxin 50 domain-containing protein n=1 Tax=Nocardioides daedukensis TaxID=634462 RepID=A0A7Y9S271_9ACTN|nr:polymorphic toxin type 50 domain-containing protein [Nocardioides daedukensis]NYG58743.1 hypothetical protein [Nocardioides daedukensis]
MKLRDARDGFDVRRLLVAIVGLLATWLGTTTPATAAAPATTNLEVTHVYAFGDQHDTAVPTHAITERDPPETYVHPTTASDADGLWSLGGSACPDGPTTPATYGYDDLARLLHSAPRSGNAEGQVGGAEAGPVVVERTGVAANGVPPRFITTGAGVTIDRASVAARVAQTQGRHVAGHANYGGRGYFNSLDDAQSVLDDFHSGAAQVLGVKRNGDIVVRSPNVTGFNHNPGAGFPNQSTNVFLIKGSSPPSVVPNNPGWTP